MLIFIQFDWLWWFEALGNSGLVTALDLSPDGRFLAIGTDTSVVKVVIIVIITVTTQSTAIHLVRFINWHESGSGNLTMIHQNCKTHHPTTRMPNSSSSSSSSQKPTPSHISGAKRATIAGHQLLVSKQPEKISETNLQKNPNKISTSYKCLNSQILGLVGFFKKNTMLPPFLLLQRWSWWMSG